MMPSLQFANPNYDFSSSCLRHFIRHSVIERQKSFGTFPFLMTLPESISSP